MAKKGDLAALLGGFTSSGRRIDRRDTAEPDDGDDAAAAGAAHVEKAPGILDPIMVLLSPEEKLQFISGLMDFMGDFIVNMLDQYSFELGKVENSIANMQSTVLNQVRTIRNQVDIARQQGHFKAQEGPPTPMGIAGMFSGNSIAAAASAVGASEEPKKKREATERDVMDIAASIRTLITRQKMVKPAATEPGKEEAPAAATTTEPAPEATGRASIDSKLQQFQKSADEQKQRIDRIASTAKPAPAAQAKPETPAKPAPRSKKGKGAVKPGSKPATKPAAAKPAAIEPAAAKPATAGAAKAPAIKLDKEKDIMPKGFQQELMKNIKGMIKDKEKETKKPAAE